MIDLTACKNVLTFFAHPDDETLAAGGTIDKLSNLGAQIHIAIPATGVHSRRNSLDENGRNLALAELRQDCENALGILGISPKRIYFGDFPDNEMDSGSRLQLIHWLENLLANIKPDLLITHHRFCTNIDHQYCHEAAIIATRPSLNQHTTLLCAEVPSSTGYLKPVQWEPNFFVELNENNLNNKLRAMATYKDEARLDPHPRSNEVLTALAKVRGADSGYYFAEAFMIAKTFA